MKIANLYSYSLVSFGKYGSFNTNQIIGRPFYLTFEILDRADLRILKASEIHEEVLLEEAETENVEDESTPVAGQFDEYGLPNDEKTNININDDPNKQKLTYAEIEALKSDETLNSRELISRIMANHTELDQKTAFSLAKYTLRKQKKYMKQFTVLPLDVPTLTDFYMEEKDFSRTMEIRNETLGLMCSSANVHASADVPAGEHPRCRYLVIDDTGGLIVAALAERMGILHHDEPLTIQSQDAEQEDPAPASADYPGRSRRRLSQPCYERDLATSNTITMIHSNQQPNLALLRYFAFDPNLAPSPYDPSPHPLHTHLRTMNWLQLLEPLRDPLYSTEIESLTPQEVNDLKSSHKSNYYRKRRRWLRTKEIVDSTRKGGFNALIIASHTNPVSICKHLVPLLAGGAQIVVYNPHIDPLMELCDVYSTSRRVAYLNEIRKKAESDVQIDVEPDKANDEDETLEDDYVAITLDEITDTATKEQSMIQVTKYSHLIDDKRFPVDPTLLLAPTVHKTTARQWQVLPGRTHPMMMGRGGAEGGYVVVSTKVIPAKGIAVQAKGRPPRGRKRQPENQGEAVRSQEDEQRSFKRGKIDDGAALKAVEIMDT